MRREEEGKSPHMEIKESLSYFLICARHAKAHPRPVECPFSHIFVHGSIVIQEISTDTYFEQSRSPESSILGVEQRKEL